MNCFVGIPCKSCGKYYRYEILEEDYEEMSKDAEIAVRYRCPFCLSTIVDRIKPKILEPDDGEGR